MRPTLVKMTDEENRIACFLENISAHGVYKFYLHGFDRELRVITPYNIIYCMRTPVQEGDKDRELREFTENLISQIESNEIRFCRIERQRRDTFAKC